VSALSSAPTASLRSAFRRFWPYTRGDRRLLVIGGVLAVAAAACEVAAIWLFGVITDHALAAKSLDAFWAPAAEWLGLALVSGLATFAGDYMTALAGERFLLRLRDSTFAHVQRLSPEFFDKNKLGDLMTRLTADIEAIEQLVASGLVHLFTSLVSVIFFAGAAFYIRWDLALVACALVPLFLLVSRSFSTKFRKVAGRERRSYAAITSLVEESLSNQSLVQAYNRQQTEEQRLHREGSTWLKAKMTETRLSALYEPIVQVVETFCVLVVLGMGAWDLSHDRITLGGLLSFAAYIGYLYPPIQSLGGLMLTAAEAGASSDRVIEVLETHPAVAEDASPRKRMARRGRIAFDAVTFCYPGAERPALERFSFRTGPGELTLITGASGSGKSTITKLLLRFYDPTAGRIRLDGVDLRELSLHAVRDNITLLQQENMLFPGTVTDNIAYGRPGVSDAEIVSAAVAADAHDFIVALPQGYQTLIGQRGRLLSGGQRQRIAIARAMVRDAPVLILDEPTTGLDAPTAKRILEPLRRLMAGRTTILITHDLYLAPAADQTIVLGGWPLDVGRTVPPASIRGLVDHT
jgi:ATP-binding cassette subfamily B protein